MNIKFPWKMRVEGSPQGSPSNSDVRARRRFRDELDVAKRPGLMVEDDLNHLGSIHKRAH